MIKIIKANKLDKNIKEVLSKLFVDSFYGYFAFISNKEKLYKAFKHIFDLNKFYVVLLGEEVIGMGACCDGISSIKFNKSILCMNLGLNNGKRIYDYLKVIFEERDYSFEMDKGSIIDKEGSVFILEDFTNKNYIKPVIVISKK